MQNNRACVMLIVATSAASPSRLAISCLQLSRGVVLNSTSRREAKRGQSTNRKGEMSRASRKKQKIAKEI